MSTEACSRAVSSATDTARSAENRVEALREQRAIAHAWEDEGGTPAEAASAFPNSQWDRYIDGDMPDQLGTLA